MPKYTIGLDFGTLSSRGVLLNLENGSEVAESEFIYPNGVIEEKLPLQGKDIKLGEEWALQSPQDYLDAVKHNISALLKETGVNPKDIIGVGVDFTACTFMPIKKDGTPLCFLEEYQENPHSWVKLWKHHAAAPEAKKLNEIAHQRGEEWILRYGGTISPEWQVPKVWQVLNEAPEIYNQAGYFIEAGDWLVWALTGKLTKCISAAGFKGMWQKDLGYPSKEFFKALDPRLENYVDNKLDYPFVQLGEKVGNISKQCSKITGLSEETAVVAANIDAHATIPAVGVEHPNTMVAVIGTSTGQLVFSQEMRTVPGISGVVEGGVYPNYFGYETGQNCVGDSFAWFVNQAVPASYKNEAKKAGVDIHTYLTNKAEKLAPGESGLIALDWWNGNRSVLVDMDLSGVMVGMTIQTLPEEMYRAMLEATAFGTRKIIENYREHGVEINAYYAAGGIAQKNSMLMQIYADVIGMPVQVLKTAQGPAFGSGVFAAVGGGYFDSVPEGAKALGSLGDKIYTPNPENQKIYDKLFHHYITLHDFFGKDQKNLMHSLKSMRQNAKQC